MNPETTTLDLVPSLKEIAGSLPAPSHAHATAWAVKVLKKAMNDGALIPGCKLSEQKISAELGISRNTLRQAFTVLAAHNLVEQIPNRGVFVASPDKEQISELMVMRLALESTAIDLSAPGEKPAIRAVIEKARQARAAGSVSAMASANQDFHRLLVAQAGSLRLDTLMSSVLAEMRLLFFSFVTVVDFHAQFVDLNAELLELIEVGEKVAAQKALRSYLAKSSDYFMANL